MPPVAIVLLPLTARAAVIPDHSGDWEAESMCGGEHEGAPTPAERLRRTRDGCHQPAMEQKRSVKEVRVQFNNAAAQLVGRCFCQPLKWRKRLKGRRRTCGEHDTAVCGRAPHEVHQPAVEKAPLVRLGVKKVR